MIFQKNKILTNKILHNYWINIKNYSIKISFFGYFPLNLCLQNNHSYFCLKIKEVIYYVIIHLKILNFEGSKIPGSDTVKRVGFFYYCMKSWRPNNYQFLAVY